MMPANFMEDKQLNFSRPLLSVRRGSSTRGLAEVDRTKPTNPPSSTPRLPYSKAELKSGPVSNPAAIPFQWERIPGKLKDQRKLQTRVVEQPPPAPKLPPGRVVNHDEESSHKLSVDLRGSTSQRRFDCSSVSDSSSAYKNAGELERAEDGEEKGSSHSEGEDSNYLDALDTLSRAESSFVNCSVSGLDDPGRKSSGTFLDPQTRDFMMGRFLPAAKAVVSETPHFGSRKQPVAKEQPTEVKKVVIPDNQIPRYYYTPKSLPQYLEDEREEEDADEDEEEEEDYVSNENVSTKFCGLLPRFCLLNPIPGIRGQAPSPIRSTDKVPKTNTNSCIYNKYEKAIRDAVYERRRLAIYLRSDTRVKANDLKDELKRPNLQSASLKVDELSRIASLENSNISPYRNLPGHSLMGKEKAFLGIPEAAKHAGTTQLYSRENGPIRFRELLADEAVEEEVAHLATANPTDEKTLYIDPTQIAEYRDSSSSLPVSKSLMNSKGMAPSINYSMQNIKRLCFSDGKTLPQSIHDNTGDCKTITPLEGVLHHKVKNLDQVEDHEQGLLTSADQNLQLILLPDGDAQQPPGKHERETIVDRNPLVHLSLPKAPSESWLSRTLPPMSSRYPLSKSYLSAKNLTLKPSPAEPKWEALVKSSSLQNNNFGLPGLLRISED